jgi:hypothetical protein
MMVLRESGEREDLFDTPNATEPPARSLQIKP